MCLKPSMHRNVSAGLRASLRIAFFDPLRAPRRPPGGFTLIGTTASQISD